MKRTARWSEADLVAIQGKHAPLSHAKVAALPKKPKPAIDFSDRSCLLSNLIDAKKASGEKRKEAKKLRIAKVIDSVKTARFHGTYVKGESIELHFEGAMMLSPNELYGLSPFLRIGYRKAWHNAVHFAMLTVTGGPRNFPPLDCFEISLHRVSTQLCDTDAIAGFFKAPIDGLTHAGIILDDKPKYFKRFADVKQERGIPKIVMTVRQIDEPGAGK